VHNSDVLITHGQISSAIKNNELLLYYQPQFNLETGSFDSIEALVRWQHPERGLISPDDFIMAVEEAEMMPSFGEWVLQAACSQYQLWLEKGMPLTRLAVNVSWTQLNHEGFVEAVKQTLAARHLPPDCLELEITENIVLHMNEERLIQVIYELKKLGVFITLDDFGTGYASISHLKRIPVDRLKIDKSYIENIHINKENAAIVRAIIALADSLGLQITVEGIESLKDMQFLSREGCREMQGFYFSRPLPAAELERFVRFYQNNSFL